MSGTERSGTGSVGEVFLAFLQLGVTSFGGPVAHLGFFREAFVNRRKWLSDAAYGELVALCQFLPGPASSQVGFGLGWLRAGPLGALAAFTAFTLPSALVLVLVAMGAAWFDSPLGATLLASLKLIAVAIVAHAVWGMARNLCPDRQRAAIGFAGAAVVLLASSAVAQIAVIAAGALAGLALCKSEGKTADAGLEISVARPLGLACLAVFALLLVGLPLIAAGGGLSLFDSFYRSGALVFGGGHVVLPLLERETVAAGAMSADTFLAGYGAAQAVPGPLFTFAAYLGHEMGSEANGIAGALIALIAIFLPGFLLLIGVLPFWNAIRRRPAIASALAGANAAVVGVLGAALYDPVFRSAVSDSTDMAIAMAGFAMLTVGRLSPLVLVLALLAVGLGRHALG